MSLLHTCTENTRPDNPQQGDLLFETDTNKLILYYAGRWITFGQTGLGASTVPTISVDIGDTSELLSSGLSYQLGDFKFDRTTHITTLQIHYNGDHHYTYTNNFTQKLLEYYTAEVQTGRIHVGYVSLLPLDGDMDSQLAQHDMVIAGAPILNKRSLMIYETGFGQDVHTHDFTEIDEKNYRTVSSSFKLNILDNPVAPNVTRNFSLDSGDGSSYIFSGDAVGADPALAGKIGDTFKFTNNTGGHVLEIKDSSDRIIASQVGTTLTWTPWDSGTYTYYCAAHPVGMRGTITVGSGNAAGTSSGDLILDSEYVAFVGDAKTGTSGMLYGKQSPDIKDGIMHADDGAGSWYMGTIQGTTSSAHILNTTAGGLETSNNYTSNSTFTYTMWFNLSGESDNVNRTLFAYSTNLGVAAVSATDESGWYLATAGYFGDYNHAPASGSPNLLESNRWYNYTLVVSGDNGVDRESHHFLDGVRFHSNNMSANRNVHLYYVGNMWEGQYNSQLDGYVTGMASWNEAFSESKITEMSNTTSLGEYLPTRWYHPNLNQSKNWYDGRIYNYTDVWYLYPYIVDQSDHSRYDYLFNAPPGSYPILSEEHPSK